MLGEIELTPRLPGAGDLLRAAFTDEARIRPFCRGSGAIYL